ncbi:fimbrial protein [Erwiniaceae bacterium CAU 1747]
MLKMKSYLLLAFLPQLAFSGDRWNVTLAGGDMHFQGLIIAEACRIEAGDNQMTVDMGRVSSNRFHSVGEYTEPVSFSIHLQECSTAVSQHVSVTFRGVADGKNPDILSVGEGPGMATGVGVALFDENDKLIPLNVPAKNRYQHDTGGKTLHLIAKYRTTDNVVVGGKVKAQAWFSLTYQ